MRNRLVKTSSYAQSPACGDVAQKGVLGLRREFPEAPRELPACAGSFDCVVVRCADDNFAQDDKLTKKATQEKSVGAGVLARAHTHRYDPVPLKATNCGLSPALSFRIRSPLAAPVAVGLN
jgi:hypothetical protein